MSWRTRKDGRRYRKRGSGIDIDTFNNLRNNQWGTRRVKTRAVRTGFGVTFVKNNWSDKDWDNYQFNLNLRESIGNKAILEHRAFSKDEKNFIQELERRNDVLRQKYGVR